MRNLRSFQGSDRAACSECCVLSTWAAPSTSTCGSIFVNKAAYGILNQRFCLCPLKSLVWKSASCTQLRMGWLPDTNDHKFPGALSHSLLSQTNPHSHSLKTSVAFANACTDCFATNSMGFSATPPEASACFLALEYPSPQLQALHFLGFLPTSGSFSVSFLVPSSVAYTVSDVLCAVSWALCSYCSLQAAHSSSTARAFLTFSSTSLTFSFCHQLKLVSGPPTTQTWV